MIDIPAILRVCAFLFFLAGAGLQSGENPDVLTVLDVSGNNLTSVDVSKYPKLERLDVSNNRLIALDLSKNPALQFLDASNNRLVKIDLSGNPLLKSLNVSNNQLTELDLSHNKQLQEMRAGNNKLAPDAPADKPTERPKKKMSLSLPQPPTNTVDRHRNGGVVFRNSVITVKFLTSDPGMKALSTRHESYMRQVMDNLEKSLRRQEMLTKERTGKGIVRVQFGIDPDGNLSSLEIVRAPAELEIERGMAERIVRGAAPFPRPLAELVNNENLQKIKVTINFL